MEAHKKYKDVITASLEGGATPADVMTLLDKLEEREAVARVREGIVVAIGQLMLGFDRTIQNSFISGGVGIKLGLFDNLGENEAVRTLFQKLTLKEIIENRRGTPHMPDLGDALYQFKSSLERLGCTFDEEEFGQQTFMDLFRVTPNICMQMGMDYPEDQIQILEEMFDKF